MNRTDLEQLDRDTLVARAEAAGVTRARILTRPELVDELLLRTADPATRQRSRGLFGVARDLLARVVEQGLHLPDAADRIRTLGGFGPAARPSAPAALPTVTHAEIYAAQGHRDRAIHTLEGVLAREPEHAVASALLAQLRDSKFPIPPPRMPPETEDERAPAASPGAAHDTQRAPAGPEQASEPSGMLDDAPLPPRYDVDECVAIPVDPRTLYVYWEARESTLAYLRAARGGGSLVLRLIVVEPTWDGPRSSTRDHEVGSSVGDQFVRDLPGGCVVRAAIGWKHGEAFVPIAHSPALETPPGAPSPLLADVLVRWTPQGAAPLAPDDGDAVAIRRALGRARREAAVAHRAALGGGAVGALGSSQQWAQTMSNG
jgi:hypothetical protein